ncbi:MAG: helix-turn-helix domain-containing GNAT family N-acetyltransferase [Syntrophaceae bacterium]
MRVLYEIAYREKPTATEIGKELRLDVGYLSRILHSFEKRGLIDRTLSEVDGRQSLLSLTVPGLETFIPLKANLDDKVAAVLKKLSTHEQNLLIDAMCMIEELLSTPSKRKISYLIRLPQPGDMGWVIHRHGVLYAEEHGWDEHFEALVAEIVAKFIHNYNPKRERCWIVERDGANVGCVFLIKTQSDDVAQLCLLLIDPMSRGLGIGTRLVKECIRFARQTHYRTIIFQMNVVQHVAQHICEKSGFQLIHEENHHVFGHDLISHMWELKL